jgi:TatD DNase family protein
VTKKKKKKILPALSPQVSLIDTHCHLDMDSYTEDLTDVLSKAFCNGIRNVVTIGINEESSRAAVQLSKTHAMVYAAVGIHPHDVGNIDRSDLDVMSSIIDQERKSIVGYGEIGLDFVKCYAEPESQKKFFRDQLFIAKDFNLPVIIHDREAHNEILEILTSAGPFDNGGIMHCFSGNSEYAKKVMDLGLHISIPGIVTFKNAKALKDVAQVIPLDSMLLESDGPFLAPDPYRGKRNEPLYLLYTAEEISILRDISIDDIAKATTENAVKLFNISYPAKKRK